MFMLRLRKSFKEPACIARRYLGSGLPGNDSTLRQKNEKIALYMLSLVVGVGGVTYAAVPLYKAFCQATGFGGTTRVASGEKASKMIPVENSRFITVTFDGTVTDSMPWKFRQSQNKIRVVPGETALAFYTASNPTDKHITGVATYNVFPLKAEQRLQAGEEIDMPVLFYIDPEMLDDPAMDNVNEITLSYTFFKTGESIPETTSSNISTKIVTPEVKKELSEHV